jgi:hypothetical protein
VGIGQMSAGVGPAAGASELLAGAQLGAGELERLE